MIKRLFRFMVRLGVLGGLAVAAYRLYDSRRAKPPSMPGHSPAASATNVVPAASGRVSPPATVPVEPPQPDLVDPVMLTSVAGVPHPGELGGNSGSDTASESGNGMGALGSAVPAAKAGPKPEKPAAIKKAPAAKKKAPAPEKPTE